MDRGVESRSVGRWAMRGQTGRRGLEAEAWGEGIQQILWNSIGGGRPQSGLDFQPSRPSWHSFQAQNVISVRGSGPRNKGGHDVTSVSVGTLPRTNGTWGAGDAPRLPIMGSRCFFPFHSPWYFRPSIMPFPCWMENVHVAVLPWKPSVPSSRELHRRGLPIGGDSRTPQGKAVFFRSLPSTGFPPWRA